MDSESEGASTVQDENLCYEALLKMKCDAPERFCDGETQTIQSLSKNQDAQSDSTLTSDKATQVSHALRFHFSLTTDSHRSPLGISTKLAKL